MKSQKLTLLKKSKLTLLDLDLAPHRQRNDRTENRDIGIAKLLMIVTQDEDGHFLALYNPMKRSVPDTLQF